MRNGAFLKLEKSWPGHLLTAFRRTVKNFQPVSLLNCLFHTFLYVVTCFLSFSTHLPVVWTPVYDCKLAFLAL